LKGGTSRQWPTDVFSSQAWPPVETIEAYFRWIINPALGIDQHGKVDAPKLCLAIAEQNAQLRIAQLDGSR
jgi:hypothetical protein